MAWQTGGINPIDAPAAGEITELAATFNIQYSVQTICTPHTGIASIIGSLFHAGGEAREQLYCQTHVLPNADKPANLQYLNRRPHIP